MVKSEFTIYQGHFFSIHWTLHLCRAKHTHLFLDCASVSRSE